MTYKEKLRELFKEVPEIKKDLEELLNPLGERHLRMYCFEKDLFISITADWFIYETGNKWEIKDIICKLDNNKLFGIQNKEVYEQIFNYLTK